MRAPTKTQASSNSKPAAIARTSTPPMTARREGSSTEPGYRLRRRPAWEDGPHVLEMVDPLPSVPAVHRVHRLRALDRLGRFRALDRLDRVPRVCGLVRVRDVPVVGRVVPVAALGAVGPVGRLRTVLADLSRRTSAPREWLGRPDDRRIGGCRGDGDRHDRMAPRATAPRLTRAPAQSFHRGDVV